jgi:hypothetical protein
MLYLSRSLALTSPHQTEPAAEIREVQSILNVRQDGEYGTITATAVRNWKYRCGFHEKFVNTSLTPSESQWLFGTRKLTAAMHLRAKSRASVKPVSQKSLATMIEWADLGTYETSTNYVPRLSNEARLLGLAPAYQRMGWSWCSFAVFLSGLKNGSKVASDLFAGSFNHNLVLYVPQILMYAQSGKFGLHVVQYVDAQPGDLVIFNWDGGVVDHIGRLITKNDASRTITTVEGNTSVGASGSQSNGDGVYKKIRSTSLVTAYVREAS